MLSWFLVNISGANTLFSIQALQELRKSFKMFKTSFSGLFFSQASRFPRVLKNSPTMPGSIVEITGFWIYFLDHVLYLVIQFISIWKD